jgi:hypothetical protein
VGYYEALPIHETAMIDFIVGFDVALAAELSQAEGNARSRRLSFIARRDCFSGLRRSGRNP